MDYDQVLDGICEAMNILEGKGGQAKSDRHVYHIGEELCNDDTGDKYDEIVIRYDPNEFLSTNGCGLYATCLLYTSHRRSWTSLHGWSFH